MSGEKAAEGSVFLPSIDAPKGDCTCNDIVMIP
jgi:hypothetical protein